MQPSLVGRGDDRDAALDLLCGRQRQRIAHHEDCRRDARERMIALGNAAGHLEINALVVEGQCARSSSLDDRFPFVCRCADWRGLMPVQASLQAG